MDGKEFERLVARVFQNLGCSRVRVIGGTGDNGVDVICTDPKGQHIAVQAKRWATPVGSPEIQKLAGGMDFHNCTVGYVVATSGFTPAARQFVNGVRNKCLELRGRDWIEREVTRLASKGLPRFTWSEYFTRFQQSNDSRYEFLHNQIGLLRASAILAAIVVFLAVLVPRNPVDVNSSSRNQSSFELTAEAQQRSAEQRDESPRAQVPQEQAKRGLPESFAVEVSEPDDTPPEVANKSAVDFGYVVHLKNGRTRQITHFVKDSRGYLCRNALGVIFRLRKGDVERIEPIPSEETQSGDDQ